ncbi:MAG TPA: uracil-DNA glycosylase [Flavobacteriales bacterium]|nr:uracil-DNA glycosylase [Flavobacteriales bacterium]|tara:strand:+ start:29373 stop:30065 length:693 start_codon:yes stop_codon:yes gene_type:complete
MNISEIKVTPTIEESWKKVLEEEFKKDYFKQLKAFLLEEKKHYRIFPPGKYIFNAFNLTPFDKVKVVILGQDPYHGYGQAHGLCFSVPEGIKLPPSLKNIFKELYDDLGVPVPTKGDLTCWAKQGVLLLNATLTVREKKAGSHQGKGWETFTDHVIKIISEKKEHVVFILWGNYAQQKENLIDTSKHYVIKSTHPSPFSAHRGFLGSKPFSKTNEKLKEWGLQPIDWACV